MPAGLQIFDQFGNLKVDIGDRLLRFLGMVVVGPGPVSGNIFNDGFLTGTPFWFSTMHTNDSISYWPGEGLLAPDVSISGNMLSYILNSARSTTRIQYGVY